MLSSSGSISIPGRRSWLKISDNMVAIDVQLIGVTARLTKILLCEVEDYVKWSTLVLCLLFFVVGGSFVSTEEMDCQLQMLFYD